MTPEQAQAIYFAGEPAVVTQLRIPGERDR